MKHALLLAGLLAVTTAQAADPKTYMVDLSLTTAAGIATPRVQVREGESFKIATGEADAKVSASFTVSAVGSDSVKLSGSVRCADGAAATPTLITRLGTAATVTVTGPNEARCQLAMTVREESQPATPQ
jgi:hypothetical protein